MFRSLFCLWLLCLSVLVLSPNPNVLLAQETDSPMGISPRVAADYIHAIIEADRTIYSEYIVERLKEAIHLPASENWEENRNLLLPAQFLSLSSKITSATGTGMSYRLMSLWPINKNNGPKTKFEKSGLKKVLQNGKKPSTRIVKDNGHTFFQAVYPDLAVTKECVRCHNAHPDSPKKDFKLGDVMGGIIINLPLPKTAKEPAGENYSLPPEVVADYVHSILQSDRTVYAKYVVNRLQEQNIIYASEHWWEENTLLLPAQFLLNASDLIKTRALGMDFRLISLWPINKHNGAANEFERLGLEAVKSQPLRPYIGYSKIGNKNYFKAIYPDLAVTPACVSCHNAHPKSLKHDFKLYDVMGGTLITLSIK